MSAPKRKFWGWGFEDEIVPEAEAAGIRAGLGERCGALPDALPVPRADEIELRAPRVAPPDSLADIATTDHGERVGHSYGQSFADIARAFLRRFPEPPDVVAYPRSTEDVVALLDWADGANVAVIPFGGGSSVCGGVEPDVGDSYAGTLSLDMTGMNRVLEVDKTDRTALIEAGARGPHFDAALKEQGLTLRHFPQSYMMATLGGMIVTRSGGHFATLYTHIDEFVEAVELVTPIGTMETRRLPGSGAGPDPNRLVSGSEGTLGVLTKAWMRLQDSPQFRASATVKFQNFYQGAKAVRAIAQSGLHPANCRLLDPQEAANSGAGGGAHAVLVLGFESAHVPQEARLLTALEMAGDHGGDYELPEAHAKVEEGEKRAARPGAAEAWRNAFLRMPYWREIVVPHGLIVDTFETACLWSDFETFHASVVQDMTKVMREVTGRDGALTCRFTHVYPDGPAPYFTFTAMSEPHRMLDAWCDIKLAANESVVTRGGTATHHHAVGRDHRPNAYDLERPAPFAAALAGAKQALDPNGILNPGVLIDPVGRPLGRTGIFGAA